MNVVTFLAEATETSAPMVLPTFVFAIIAASFFLVLALVTLSFRDVANRHSQKWVDKPGDDAHH